MTGDVSRVKLLVTLGGGGFHLETQSLLRRLGNHYEYSFIMGEDCAVPSELLRAPVHRIRPFALLREPQLWKRIPAFSIALLQTFRALRKAQPDCVVCVGAAMAVPLGVAARVMRIPVVYIESITRFERPSLTATIMARLRLADRLYVQWPDSVHLYRGGIYRGTIL